MDEYKSLYDIFGVNATPSIGDSKRAVLELLKEQQEANLSSYAIKSSDSRGRHIPEVDSDIRSCYERDTGRIIFSQSFRRLKHKTQVFFNPTNDHICSRLEHVIYVDYIASTIGKALNLNVDLIHAIALGHDIGHAPFGHSGERILSKCLNDIDSNLFFEHEAHGLRVIDVLEGHGKDHGLNLTFEVRDGILSHCGETYDEHSLKPNRDKTEEDFIPFVSKKKRGDQGAPATLEGCVVRFSDKIAYVGRDVEDALRAGIIEDTSRFAPEASAVLGVSNSQIINSLVEDIICNSLDKDEIRMSDASGAALTEFLNTNNERIYQSKRVKVFEETVKIMMTGLFDAYYTASEDVEAALSSNKHSIRKFAEFAMNHPEQDAPRAIKVTDFIAGMTDQYATDCFNELYKN